MPYVNSIGGVSRKEANAARAEFGAHVVTKTLDYMNRGKKGGSSQAIANSYNFNMDILGAVYSPKGLVSSVFA